MNTKQHKHFGYKLLGVLIVIGSLIQVFTARGFDDPLFFPDPTPAPQDTTADTADTLVFPIEDNRTTDPQQDPERSAIDLEDPENVHREIHYDPETGRYYFSEKVGDNDIRTPTYLESDEYRRFRARQAENQYFKQRLDALSMFNQKPDLPALTRAGLFDRLFGGNTISIKPQGNLDLTFGGSWQNLKNPSMVQSTTKYGIFDFDMNMNVNLVAQIGEKLKLNISQNTQPTFGDQNTKKIEYTGNDDEIIKKIEAGNVSFPLNSSLLSGPLSLFGLKTQLQFGKLFVTGVISQQQSQRKTINIEGGAQTEEFEIKADDYEENRNFLLGQYFHDNYEKALENLPVINSPITLQRVEVWVSNKTGATQGVRDVMAFMDLGEKNPYLPTLSDPGTAALPDNRANRLYEMLGQTPGARIQSTATQSAMGLGLTNGQDFQRSTMRQLNASEFTFHPQLGFISLNTQVNADDIVAVAYRYTYNGKVYQVGEFAEDFPPGATDQKILFLKMLKGGTSGNPKLPIWDLMMKNIYTLGTYTQISPEDFRLNVVYQDPGGGEKRYLPDGPSAGIPLITLLHLDRLNRQQDPGPDGVFDFVEGVTINTQQGKIIFPTLEPFGSSLKPALGGNPQLEKRYLFQMLYDSTKAVARQFQQNNRFLIKGSYKGSGGSEIRLGGFNIPEGSVSVTAGGQRLTENVDYSVDYSRGTVKILNQGILSSGIPISISFEDNATFGFVQQSFWGARFDYFANEHLTIGSTIMRLTERPFSEKVQVGDDPLKNTVVGLDVNYQNEFPALTRALDKLPFYSTTAPSLIAVSGEVAGIFPGHHKFINATDPDGSVSIDDFEGANSSIDLRFPPTSWSLASTPAGATDELGNILFPEAQNADLSNGQNRAKLAWYMLDPDLIDGFSGTPENIKSDTALQDYWRLVQQQELFPQKHLPSIQNALTTFDLGYYPHERGPYNYTSTNIDADGRLLNPKSRWGGIQRAIENNSSDFEASNVEYITFWVLDPFIYNPTSEGGNLYINLGDVSEDVLKDGRMSFENGIPYPKDLNKLDLTPWGYVPRFQQQITEAFDNDPAARAVQDVGYDELDDAEEQQIFADFLTAVQAVLNPAAFQRLQNDPSSDNFHHYRGDDYDQARLGVLARYKNFNNPDGNSPISALNQEFISSGTSLPESEDLNHDNTLNENEAYYQYRIRIQPNMAVGTNFVADKKVATVQLKNGQFQQETWYQFKVPIREYDKSVGGINDFRSIRFIRLFLSDFEDSLTLRFAQLQLDRNQWRRYLFSLTSPGENIPEEDLRRTSFALGSVSLEENFDRQPVPYRIPPGVNRQNAPGGITGENLEQDEQSLSLQICGLKDGDARAVFKQQSIDMRQYKHMKMFIHAESTPNEVPINDGDLVAFIRVGSDFTNNYYEYQIPLKVTRPGTTDPAQIWPKVNEMDVYFDKFVAAKTERNNQNLPAYLPYQITDDQGNKIIVVGNPNFGDVKNIMLGVANPKKTLNNPGDDGLDKCAEVWFDELRMAGLDEQPGYAASGQTNIQLADLGNVHLGASMHTMGYGNIDQRVAERFRDNFYSYDANSNLNLGKLLPQKWGLQVPVFIGYAQTISNPKYNPYDKDVLLKDQLSDGSLSPFQRDSIRKAAQDFTSITSFNLTNVRYMGNPEKQGKLVMPWSLKNFDLSYSYNKAFQRNPLLSYDALTDQRLSIGYNYSLRGKFYEPFKKLIKSKSKWLTLVKDFNFSLLPSSFTFRNDLHRIFGETQVRNVDGGPYQLPATYYKNFTWDRTYNLSWELTRSLSFNYSAVNQSRIDEPNGRINTSQKRDSVLSNLSRFGRNTYFSQNLNVTYKVPTQKIPLLDWTNLQASYTSTYNWTGASLLAKSMGNTIANTQTKQINADFNFTRLYHKSRWLRAINTPKPVSTVPVRKEGNGPVFGARGNKVAGDDNKLQGSDEKKQPVKAAAPPPRQQVPPRPKKKKIDKEAVANAQPDSLTRREINKIYRQMKKTERKRFRKELAAWRAKRNRILPEISDGLRVGGRIVTMLKRVNINYSENAGTVIPGFMDSTRFFGVNTRSDRGWYDFAFGFQPDRVWLDQQAALSRISRDSIFNGQMHQTYAQNYNIQATLEPFPDMRIDLNWTKQFSKDYSETFKFDPTLNDYQHFSPYTLGTFSVSYIGLSTMFSPVRSNAASSLYLDFMNNRKIISRRLGAANPYTNGLPDPSDPDYAKGYTQYAQDVLIPAFLAAYGGRDVQTIPLVAHDHGTIRSNPFKGYFPMPNWNLTYNGLSKLPAFRESMSNFSLSHGYTGNLSMNGFASSFYFVDMFGVGFPSFIDSNSHNYVPFFQVPNITITESFGPLLGLDIAFKNGLNISIKFNKSRMLSLSLIDYQVSETKSSEIIIGGGHRIPGLQLPFSIFGLERLKNDINIRVDLGYRTDITTNSYLLDNTVIPTQGQQVLTIAPSIDYIINDQLQLRLFFDRRQSIPVVSTSYPLTNTRAGVTLRYLFAPQ